ncbi:MAG: nucleotidyltransferase family protein [Phycisphaerales bacterium]
MVAAIVSNNRRMILDVLERHGARQARVFGSTVRGERHGNSDLDLLVTMDADRSLLDRIAAAQELGDALGVAVDLVNERALPPSLRDRILAEAVAL